MPLGTHAKQHEVKARYSRPEHAVQLGFIVGGSSSGVRILGSHAMDIGFWYWNVPEHRLVRHTVVAVGIVRRDMAFVAPKKLDFIPSNIPARGEDLVKRARRRSTT